MANTWTNTMLWDATKAISSPRLNAYIGNDGVNPGNLDYLFGRPLFWGWRTAALTTTSTVYVDLDTTNMQAVVTPSGTKLLVWFTAYHAGRDGVNYDLMVDGVSVTGAGLLTATAGAIGWPSFIYEAVVTAGVSHTIKVRWKDPVVGTFAQVDRCTFAVYEVG